MAKHRVQDSKAQKRGSNQYPTLNEGRPLVKPSLLERKVRAHVPPRFGEREAGRLYFERYRRPVAPSAGVRANVFGRRENNDNTDAQSCSIDRSEALGITVNQIR